LRSRAQVGQGRTLIGRYDGLNRLVQMDDDSALSGYTYDSQYRLLSAGR